MKSRIFLPLIMLAFTLALGCQKEDAVAPGDPTVESRANNNSYAFPKTAHPYGKSITAWTQDWWAHMFSFGCDEFPILDEDGSNAIPSTAGPVIFLPGNFGGVTERTITVPHGKAMLFPIVNVLWVYHPCYEIAEEDQWFADGTLEENILEIFNSIFSQGADLSVTLDGYSFTNLTNYRHTSGLYSFNPNAELAGCFGDPCLAETGQLWLTDGYWIMLKPLQRGQHTLNFAGLVQANGFELDITYNITVE
jgi:hypothetical protein